MKILIACFVIFTSLTAFAGNEDLGEGETDNCTEVNDTKLKQDGKKDVKVADPTKSSETSVD